MIFLQRNLTVHPSLSPTFGPNWTYESLTMMILEIQTGCYPIRIRQNWRPSKTFSALLAGAISYLHLIEAFAV